jgi:hypothetical protein
VILLQTIIPYVPASWVSFILFIIVGLLVGAAIKKAVMSVVLFVIAVLIASFAGLNILSFYSEAILQHIPAIFASAYNHFGPAMTTLPIAFLIGVAIGFWKG